MFYSEFAQKLNETKGIKRSIRCYNHLIEDDGVGCIYVDGDETLFETLDEARQSILKDIATRKLAESATADTYQVLTENKIASVIRKYSEEKITDKLIEQYISLASSKVFTTDPIVAELRSLNKIDQIFDNKVHFVLDDNSTVIISEELQRRINRLLVNQQEIVSYMKESNQNFSHVINLIGE